MTTTTVTLQEELLQFVPIFRERAKQDTVFGQFPKENIQNLIDAGYTKSPLCTTDGGQGLTASELVHYQQIVASGDGPTAVAIGWHVSTLYAILRDTTWPEKTKRYVIEEVKKGALLNYVLSERGAGSPTRNAGPQTTAKKVEGGYLINGHKSFATLAPALDLFIISANCEGEEALFVVPNSESITIDTSAWDSVAMRGTASSDVYFKDVFVEEQHFIKYVNIAHAVRNSPASLLHIPACYIGIAQAARDEAFAFARAYVPRGRATAIIDAAHIQQKLGEIEWRLATATSHLAYGALLFDEERSFEEARRILSSAKITATHYAIEVVDLAMRIVGASGLSEKSILYRYYLNVRAGLHNPPSDDEIYTYLTETAQ